ncbi:hypothetical protein [Sphingomonas sp. 2378]|uniref:hypothetical protein n=1 Tax=Sphingomonas sp. 2378 TaxID=1219748 RepID=UPI00311AC146
MKQLSFDALQQVALYELYMSTVMDGIQFITADQLCERAGCTKGYLLTALTELEERTFVKYNSTATSRSSSITPNGIRYVEKGLIDPKNVFSQIRDQREKYDEERTIVVRSVPASDRIVRLDHNNPQVEEMVATVQDLKVKIRMGNDLGDLTAEEAQAAAQEVEQIELALKGEFVRPEQIAAFARKSLKWIGDKAAGAAVGKAALALLAMIAAFFGIDW